VPSFEELARRSPVASRELYDIDVLGVDPDMMQDAMRVRGMDESLRGRGDSRGGGLGGSGVGSGRGVRQLAELSRRALLEEVEEGGGNSRDENEDGDDDNSTIATVSDIDHLHDGPNSNIGASNGIDIDAAPSTAHGDGANKPIATGYRRYKDLFSISSSTSSDSLQTSQSFSLEEATGSVNGRHGDLVAAVNSVRKKNDVINALTKGSNKNSEQTDRLGIIKSGTMPASSRLLTGEPDTGSLGHHSHSNGSVSGGGTSSSLSTTSILERHADERAKLAGGREPPEMNLLSFLIDKGHFEEVR
jgi:hypothetical protein